MSTAFQWWKASIKAAWLQQFQAVAGTDSIGASSAVTVYLVGQLRLTFLQVGSHNGPEYSAINQIG